jgi:hypothetical protein
MIFNLDKRLLSNVKNPITVWIYEIIRSIANQQLFNNRLMNNIL